jgi:hypothetical protein
MALMVSDIFAPRRDFAGNDDVFAKFRRRQKARELFAVLGLAD